MKLYMEVEQLGLSLQKERLDQIFSLRSPECRHTLDLPSCFGMAA